MLTYRFPSNCPWNFQPHLSFHGPAGQRRGGFEPGRLGPLRKDIRTFVKCFLATTGRNRVGQIGRASKNPFRRSSAPPRCYQRLGPCATVFATSDFRSPLTQDFSITSNQTSRPTNHTRHWTNDRSLSRDSSKRLSLFFLFFYRWNRVSLVGSVKRVGMWTDWQKLWCRCSGMFEVISKVL